VNKQDHAKHAIFHYIDRDRMNRYIYQAGIF